MDMHRALRVASGERRGSSRPVVIETEAGRFFTKLRGVAQGPAVLVAEMIVAALAQVLGLLVPPRAASRGWNLGFRVLEAATEFRADHLDGISRDVASKVVWLDGLVMNPDRTSRNPNLLVSGRDLWLIDHGATLGFQHNWAAVTELSPRRSVGREAGHVLASRATRLIEWDGPLAARLEREVIRAAVQTVPDDFLEPLLGSRATPVALTRRREAYVAFLWKRLKPPRPFVPTTV